MYRFAASLLTALPLALIATTADAAAIRIQNANYDADGRQIVVKGVLDAIPAGTRVDLVQVSNARALASDADGNKQFGFHVPIAAGQAVPCHLRVQAGEEEAYVEVRHSSTCTQQLLSIEGQVTDAPIPYATVTVTVGGVTYTTIANELGEYTLDIATASIEELVTIEATKQMTTGQTIEFVSLAGSFSKLLEDANGGVLSGDTSQKVNVTNVSTAEYVLLVEANGGTAPTTIEELQQAETQVDASELLQIAAVIKMIVDGVDGTTYSLPAQYDTILEFVSTPGAVDSFVASVPPEDLNQAVTEILGDNGLVAGFQVGDIPARYFVTAAVEPGFIPRAGEVIEFDTSRPNDCRLPSDGCTGLRMSRVQNGTPVSSPIKWYLENGVLVTDLITPVVYVDVFNDPTSFKQRNPDAMTTDGNFFTACATSDFVVYDQTISGYRYTRYNDGQAVDSLSQRENASYGNFHPVWCETSPGVFEARTIVGFVRAEAGNVLARDSGSIAPRRFVRAGSATGAPDEVVADGQWSMQVYAALRQVGQSDPFPRVIFSDAVTLADNLTVNAVIAAEDGSSPTTWSIDPVTHDLLLTYPGGWQQRVIVTDSLDVDGNGDADEYGAFSLFTGPGGERYGSSELTLRRDTTLVADAALLFNPLNKYWQTVVNAWLPRAWEDDPVTGGRRLAGNGFFGFRAAPVSQGFRGSWNPPVLEGTENCDGSPYWWRQAFVDYSFEFPGTLNVVSMDYRPGGPTSQRSRTWSVLSTMTVGTERRLYVLELEKRPNLTGEPHQFPPRPNAYREYTEPNINRGVCLPTNTFIPAP